MTIHNASASELRRKGMHYTVLPSHILKSIRSADALAIWVFLQSQADGYIVRPAHIQVHLDIGEIRYAKAMAKLRKYGLVDVKQQRNEQGHIIGNYIDCYSEPTETLENPESGKTQNPENPESGESPPLIKYQENNQVSKEQSNSADAPSPVRQKSCKVTMLTWLTQCEKTGEGPITADDPLFMDRSKTGLPDKFILLAWYEFRDVHKFGDRKDVKYTDWRATFRNCVRSNWYKLWAIDADGAYFLTTLGKMAMRRHEQEMAA